MQHVAIIMDGNGRWAKQRLMPRHFGHREGAEALRRTIKAAVELGIRYLSVYTFSTENWKRPTEEVDFLMGLFVKLLKSELDLFVKHEIRLRCLGDLSQLPRDLQVKIVETEQKTTGFTKLQLNLMLNYGGRAEIVRACNTLVQGASSERMIITEEDLSAALYTSGTPDPDILIRTGGDFRISNFLLWQCAYSELFFLPILWPDFNKETLEQVLQEFKTRERRYGGVLA